MLKEITECRITTIQQSLSKICHESGILKDESIEDFYHHDLIESGIIDSMGVVCLQDQIETHYKVSISLDQFIAELHTFAKLVDFLATDTAVRVPA